MWQEKFLSDALDVNFEDKLKHQLKQKIVFDSA